MMHSKHFQYSCFNNIMVHISLILIFTFDLVLCNNAFPLANNTPIGKKYVLDALDPTVIILTGGYYEGMYSLILVRESSG